MTIFAVLIYAVVVVGAVAIDRWFELKCWNQNKPKSKRPDVKPGAQK